MLLKKTNSAIKNKILAYNKENMFFCHFNESAYYGATIESGIDVAPWINVDSGKFDKKNKRSPLKCANLCSEI